MSKIFSIALIIILVSIGTMTLDFLIHVVDPDNIRVIETKCVDRNHAEMIGLTCQKQIVCGWGIGTEVCKDGRE